MVSKPLIHEHISHDEFVSVNNVFGEYDDMEVEIKNQKTLTANQRF